MSSSNTSKKVSAVGLAMGIAETIPGVSGGTIAFIFRIYQELLSTIKAINPTTIGLLLRGHFSDFFKAVNGKFLISLLVGMASGIVIGVFGISYLLDNYPLLLWSFFFGLVLASAIYLSKDVNWNTARIALLVLGGIVAYAITLISPTNGSDNLVIIMLSGILAISALMLPGLSGSFILLLLGMYSTVIGAVKGFLSNPGLGHNLYVLVAFGIGCLLGLFSFARVLSYTFKRHFHSTMALMIGILIGSLNKIWPWRIPDQIMDKSNGIVYAWSETHEIAKENLKIITEQNLLPSGFSSFSSPQIFQCVLSFLVGMMLIFMLSSNGKTKNS